MRRVAKLVIRLYPRQWRARYGEEFETLIEDSSPGWRAMLDLLKEAIRMQMHVPAFPKLAAILSMTGLAVGFALSLLITPVYMSTAEMQLSPAFAGSSAVGPDVVQRLVEQALSRTSLSMIIQDPRLDIYNSERAHMPTENVIERMRRDVRIEMRPPGNGNVRFRILFSYRDPQKARATVQALVDRFINVNLEMGVNTDQQLESYRGELGRLEARVAGLEKRLGIASPPLIQPAELGSARAGDILAVLDPPSLPARPVKPARAAFGASGFGAGFAAALVIASLRRRPPAIPFPA
ncbi:MAG TPA: hypothetical protein VG273_00610 [Bryobacteraceae bacterium]|jgi:hypothetical protein|nr:hypothetical protein [Bryobacteraceae bacterium]